MERVYSVRQVNTYIKRLFLGDYSLSRIAIKGEVSNCKYHSSGHIYFTLKDEKSSMRCVMFSSQRRNGLNFLLQDGQTVIVDGRVDVYERDGTYQLYASRIRQEGFGELYERFEQLKARLNEEGLFDFEHKKPIPQYATKIGVVTASTGAAVQDIISIAKRRNPYVQLYLYPAKVQGRGAAESVAKGIKTLDTMGLDIIIVGRGGGSIEDLWAFNEEIVAYAIYDAKTPVISGTGHETDTTIADYVADKRAATPSAACELAVFEYDTFQEAVQDRLEALQIRMHSKTERIRRELEYRRLHLDHLNPVSELFSNRQYLAQKKEELEQHMHNKLQILQDRLKESQLFLLQDMPQKVQYYRYRLEVRIATLHGLSPTAKLINGYGYVTTKGVPVRSAAQVKKGDSLEVTMKDGTVYSKVI